jgi:hypothetical protein
MINQIHRESQIGIKMLSDADLGISPDSHQTHIGLFESTFDFTNTQHLTASSLLIFDSSAFDVLTLLDYIENLDGSFRSPKIRQGYAEELVMRDIPFDSALIKIREIANDYPANLDWYLLWIMLESTELVFLLFQDNSTDFREIQNIVGTIGERQTLTTTATNFERLVAYLNGKLNQVNSDYYTELEIQAQVGEQDTTQRKIPRPYDLEKANELFKKTGLKGEELLFQYLEHEKTNLGIRNLKWMNKNRESGLPYDFEITYNNNDIFFSDAKSTGYRFEQPIVISSGELKFINENKEKFLIHRLYSIYDDPKLRVCNNIYHVSDIFNPLYQTFSTSLNANGLSSMGSKLLVPTDLNGLDFDNEISVDINP